MTTITGPRALPHKGTPAPEAISTTADVIELVRRSNHATAFAGWTVTTVAMCLVFLTGTLRSVESFTVTLVLIGVLVPVLAATARTGILLAGAVRAGSVVGGEGEPAGAAAGPAGIGAHASHAGHTDLVDNTDDAGHTDPAGHEAATRQAAARLQSAVASVQVRDAFARRALVWAYGSGAAFLAWGLAVMILASR